MRAVMVAALLLAAPVAVADGLTDTGVAQPTADVPGSFDDASAAFSAGLTERHPPGSPAAALREALDAEGFVVEGDGAARLSRPGFLCELGWLVRWTEADGVLLTVEGEHYGICL